MEKDKKQHGPVDRAFRRLKIALIASVVLAPAIFALNWLRAPLGVILLGLMGLSIALIGCLGALVFAFIQDPGAFDRSDSLDRK